MTIPHTATGAELNDALWHGDAITAAAAAEQLGATPGGALPGGAVDDWLVTVYDKMWRPAGIIGDYLEHSGLDPRNGLPAATLKLKGDDPHIPMFLTCRKTMVGVTIETEGLRWAFYVDTFDLEFKPEGDDGAGVWVGTANLVGIWDILNYLQVWPDFWAPIQAQIFSHAVVFGPMVSSIEILVMEQALRIQLGLWEFINNALSFDLDIAAWFGTLLEYQGNIFEMLQAPVVVALNNPLTDPSMLVIRTIRMESCGAVIKEMTKSTGIDVRVDLWLPGDAQPDNVWIELKLPSYVVRVTDRSQITGPTHSILDSVIKTLVDLAGSVMGDILAPLILGADEVPGLPQGFWIAPALGVNFLPPWVLLVAPEPGQPGSVETCRITAHTPKGWQQIIGGRSPQWLNDLINLFFEWLIDAISIFIGFAGVPNDLMAGFLNNAFLAFQLWESFSRRHAVGIYHPGIEVFHATASAPYNLETIFQFINAFWDSRGWLCVQATCRDGQNYKLGRDIFRGQLISIAILGRSQLYTDFLESVSWRVDRERRDLMLQIGDGKAIESPLAKHQRNLTGLFEALNVITLAPQSG